MEIDKKNLVLCFFIALSFIFFSPISFSNYLDSASSDLIYEKAPTEDKNQESEKKHSLLFNMGVQQISGFIVSADHVTQPFFTGSYQFKKLWSASVSQKLNRRFFLNPNSNDQGIWIQDTILSLSTQLEKLPYDNQLKLALSSTLPLSYASQVKNTFTISTASLNWSWKLDSLFNFRPKWMKNIVLFATPVFRYYLSPTSTPTVGQSSGGNPLPQFLFGVQSMGLSLSITDYFSLNGSFGRWAVSSYKTKYARDEHSPYTTQHKKHYYLFSLSGTMKIKKQWGLSLSYSHLDRLNKLGYNRIVLFDNRLSSWSVSAFYSFSLDVNDAFRWFN